MKWKDQLLRCRKQSSGGDVEVTAVGYHKCRLPTCRSEEMITAAQLTRYSHHSDCLTARGAFGGGGVEFKRKLLKFLVV